MLSQCPVVSRDAFACCATQRAGHCGLACPEGTDGPVQDQNALALHLVCPCMAKGPAVSPSSAASGKPKSPATDACSLTWKNGFEATLLLADSS